MKTREFDGFRKIGPDSEFEDQIEEQCEKHGIRPLDAIKQFPVLARRQWLKRFLAHTELFKLTLEVPGDIAELGVFRGHGLMTWANLLECYCIGDRTKIVYGFDNWKGFTELSDEDGSRVEELQKEEGGFSPARYFEELRDAIALFDSDRFVPWKSRIKLVEGDIETTIPSFVEENPGVRFSLIHFDCDLYKPKKIALEHLFPRVSRGGVILFDEYSIKDWPGETEAVDEYFSDHPGIELKKFSWTNAPAAYLVKR